MKASAKSKSPAIAIPRRFVERYVELRRPMWIEIGEPDNFVETCMLIYIETRGILLQGDRIGTVPGSVIEMRARNGNNEHTTVCLPQEPFDQLTIKEGNSVRVELLPR